MLSSSFSQTNLIYNGDFELYDTCPTNVSTPGDYQIEHCLGWKSPTYATSDYFNTCASTQVGIPNNALGFQYAYNGNGYCGFLFDYELTYGGYWWEYIQSKLNEPLKQGYEYEFSFYVSLANSSEYALWEIGVAFTELPISRMDAKPFNVTAQIMNTANNFITDTTGWTEIKGKFVSQGGENYITIGFFSDTLSFDTLKLDSLTDPQQQFFSYYFIDACSLSETGNAYEIPNVFTPNGDGLNDMFVIKGLENDDEVQVYDRWGIPLSQFNGEKVGWDGYTTAGIKCSNGVYYYVVQKTNGEIIKGFIHLLY